MQTKADGESYADWLARFEAEYGKVKLIGEDRLSHLETIVPDWGINRDNILRDLIAEVRRLRDANARLEDVVNDMAARVE